jgi:hypothetical protein
LKRDDIKVEASALKELAKKDKEIFDFFASSAEAR